MEERPPGGVPGGVDSDSEIVSGWLSSSPVVGGTVGPQRLDITERNFRHTGGAIVEAGASRLSHGRGLADQSMVAPLQTSRCGTGIMDGRSSSSTASEFVGASTSGALRAMQRDFNGQSAARGLTGVFGQTTGELREAESSAHSSAGRLSPRRQQLQLVVNAAVTRSMRTPRPRGQPTRFDSAIVEALLQLDPGTTEDDLSFELKAHAATETKASSYYAELKQMLGEARSATQDSTPVLGIEPRAYSTRLPVDVVSEAFGKGREASPQHTSMQLRWSPNNSQQPGRLQRNSLLGTGSASKPKGLQVAVGLRDDYYYRDNGVWVDWPMKTALDWWWLLYEDTTDCTGHHGCVWYCCERLCSDPAPERYCNTVISTFAELLRLERRLRRELDSHGDPWGLRLRPLYRWFAPQTAGEVGLEFVQVSWVTFLTAAARQDGSSWWNQASHDGSGWWQSIRSPHPSPGSNYHPTRFEQCVLEHAGRRLSPVSTTLPPCDDGLVGNGTPEYVPPTKAEQDEVLAKEFDRVQHWDRGDLVWSDADLCALREKGRAAVDRSMLSTRGITKYKLQQQVRKATAAEGRRRDAAARASHREQQRQWVTSLPDAQTVVSLMTSFMPAEGPAQVVAANTAASNMAAQVQLEGDILQAAVERRLRAKSSAYDTLVYENGNARGGVNAKLRDREINCLTRDGVPIPAARQFVLGKIASHRERLSANISLASESNDDSDSLPDMS